MTRFGAIIVIRDSDVDTGGCTDKQWHAQWFSHWKNGADNHDVTM